MSDNNGMEHPAVDRSRNLALERQLTRDAASAAKATATAEGLIALAEVRAGPGPVADPDGRNFGHEVLGELADARNELCWWLEQVARGADRHPEIAGELTAAVAQTLAALTVAFQCADRAQALMVDWHREVVA